MNKNEVILHGECMVFTSNLPKMIKKIDQSKIKNGYVIVADSETTGNHHVVDIIDGVDVFENESGVIFVQNSVPTKIRCLHADRHDEETLMPGTYEFGFQQEYDPFSVRLQNVRD